MLPCTKCGRDKLWFVDCLGSEPRLSLSHTGVMRRLSGAWVKPPRLGEGSEGRAPTLHRIPFHLAFNWGKSQKTSVRVTKWRSAVQCRTRLILSTWPSQAMASTGLLSPEALRFCVRWWGQPSVSFSISRVSVLGDSPLLLVGQMASFYTGHCWSACSVITWLQKLLGVTR